MPASTRPASRLHAALLAALLAALSPAWPCAAQVTSIGLSSVRAQHLLNETVAGFQAQPEDHYGWAVAVGDFNGDGLDDLAIGTPSETAGGPADRGAISVLCGSLFADGFETGPGQSLWSQ